jgi:hypothetical protein
MLTVGNAPITVWTFNTKPRLKAIQDKLQPLISHSTTYIFANEDAVVNAFANPDQNVNLQIKKGAAQPVNTTTTINSLLAAIAKEKRQPDKAAYNKAMDEATAKGNAVFDGAVGNAAKFNGKRVPHYFQGAYMSGDQFAVGAALVHDATSRLILLYQADEDAKARALVRFYVVSCKLTTDRLFPVQVANSKVAYQDVNSLVDARINAKPLPVLGANLSFLTSIPLGPFLLPVGGATTNVAACVLQGDSQGVIRKEWGSVDPNRNSYWAYRVDKYLNGKVTKGQKYVILWTRFSGKDGGAHPELDDSWTGIGQVIHELLKANQNVIVVGRPRTGKDIPTKINEHLDALDEAEAVPRARMQIWGEYWKKEGGDPNKKIIGPSRAAEYAIFLRMISNDWNCRLVHLGMRSGAMDAAALLGMRTLFIEDKNNQQIGRTTKWTGAGNNNPLYQRIDVDELPTWTARTMKHGHTEDDDIVRGYGDADLKKIIDKVQTALA